MVRRALEETQNYRVFVVNSKAAAIVRADEESCTMAFLDLDMGEGWVEEVGQSLRTIIPVIKLFVLAQDETPPTLDSIRPWTLIRKPFQASDVLKTLAGSGENVSRAASKEEIEDRLPWLTDVNKAAQHLTRLTLESSSQAALITREKEVWAYAGQLSQSAAQEVAKTVARNWDKEKGGDLLRFVRLESTKAEHMLYATPLSEGMLLAMVFDAETPFSTIRSQASQLASALDENEIKEDQMEQPTEAEEVSLDTHMPLMSQVDDEEEENFNIPSISDILKDIPTPDPKAVKAPPPVEAAPPAAPQETRRPVDPGETRKSIFTREIAGHFGKRPDHTRTAEPAGNPCPPASAGRVR